MADSERSVASLARTAARCTSIDELADAALRCLQGSGVDAAAVWSRVGHGSWHRIAVAGSTPDQPPAPHAVAAGDGPATGELDGWRWLEAAGAHRGLVLGIPAAGLDRPRLELLQALLEAGLRRLDAEEVADSAARTGAQRLAAILDATPDAVVIVGLDGVVLDANVHASELFGHPLDELVGGAIELLLPTELRDRHRRHRDTYSAAPTARSMAAGQDLYALRRDGTQVPVDVALEPLEVDGRTAVAAFVRDATARRRAEEHRQRLDRANMAQQQALELNDNIVQGLTTALWLLEVDEPDAGSAALRDTLHAARTMMADLLQVEQARIAPGMLRRTDPPPSSDLRSLLPARPRSGDGHGIRVVVADDSEDIRVLLEMRLQDAGMELLAMAEDGQDAVEAVEEHRPDVVIMDLSMPVLDGLQASALLRAAHPHLRIVVLSGHPREVMAEQALAAGADAYVQKGRDFEELIETVRAQVHQSTT